MSLETNINASIMEAMKAKQEGRLRALRGIKSAIILAKTEKGATGELTEENQLCKKSVSSAKNSMISMTQNRS